MDVYKLLAVRINTTHIPVSDASCDPQLEALMEGAASEPDPTYANIRASKPMVRFTTPALGTLLGIANPIEAITSANTLTLMFAKMEGPTYDDTSVHIFMTCNEGVLTVDSVSGTSPAKATCTLHCSYDGTNLPFIRTTNNAFPTLTPLAELYGLHSAVVAYGSGSTLQIPLSDATFNTGLQAMQERAQGSVHPTFAAISEYAPTLNLTSAAIKSVLDVIGIDSLVSTSVTLYYGKLAVGSGWDSSGHVSMALVTPLVTLDSIQASHNQVATISLTCYALDAGSGPVTYSTSATLPTVTALSTVFTCGPAAFNSAMFDTLQWSFNAGLQVEHRGHSGEVSPSSACVLKRMPTFSVTVMDVDQEPVFGSAETGAVVYLRKIAEGAARVAAATEEHISFTLASGLAVAGESTGNWGGYAQQTITLQPRYDGTNAIVAIDTTAEIA